MGTTAASVISSVVRIVTTGVKNANSQAWQPLCNVLLEMVVGRRLLHDV